MRAVPFLRFAVFQAFVAASVFSGCGEDSPTKPPPGGGGPPVYPVLSTPQNVLTALEIAYSHRDSTETKALYDSSYVGESQDMTDNSFESFSYADEVRHVAILARSTTITSVTCEFGPPASWTRFGSSDPSHPDWAVIQLSGSSFLIEVSDVAVSQFEVSGAGELFEFLFKPTAPESTSPTDTLWKIVHWSEVCTP